MRYALIMAGGSGTRLWPMSTQAMPKQLLPLVRGRSLLHEAMDRLEGLIEPSRRLICTSESLRQPIRQALPDVSDEQILGEPQGRDTLAAVGLPAAIAHRRDPLAVMAIFTADHIIEPRDVFQQRVRLGFELLEKHPGRLVTFGINPTHPATGYGYVQLGEPVAGFDGAHVAARFKEKPDAATARQYLESGQYRWNSGMFIWRTATLLACIERYEPSVYSALMNIADAWNTPRRQRVLEEIYPEIRRISVDYAVLERAAADEQVGVVTISMPVRWLDVGSWPAAGQIMDGDEDNNRTCGARAVALDSRDNLFVSSSEDHLIAAIGVRDLIVVHTPRATLICPRDQAQRIKDLHARIGQCAGPEYL